MLELRKKNNLIKLTAMIMAMTSVGGIATTVGAHANSVLNLNSVQAKNYVAARSHGIDVASYQAADVNSVKRDAQFAIIKISEGTSYRNPKASSQLASAKRGDMLPMAYHFATFSNNASAAQTEAHFAIATARRLGFNHGYLACDWEDGDGNKTGGNTTANTNAVKTFMSTVKAAGYKPLLYANAYTLNHRLNLNSVLNSYPNSLWMAAFTSSGQADFSKFPATPGVKIWQFTDHFGGAVDGNINLLPLNYNGGSTSTTITQAPKLNKKKQNKKVMRVTHTVMHKAYVYDKNGKKIGNQVVPAYTRGNVLGGVYKINGKPYLRIGGNQYIKANNVTGFTRKVTQTTYIVNDKGIKYRVPALKTGSRVQTYGGHFTIKGKKYYRIKKDAYILMNDVTTNAQLNAFNNK